MKTIYGKMRKKAIGGRLIAGLLMVLVGLACAFASCEDLIKWSTTKKDVFETESWALTTKTWYTCNNNLLLDWYGSDEEGYYYITPTAEDNGYMGFYVYSEDKATADKIMEETQAYWFGETEAVPTTYITGRGYVYNMETKEQQYFKEWFESAGADQAMMDNLCYKTFVLTPKDKIFDPASIVVAVIFGVLAIWGVILFLSFFTGAYKKDVKKMLNKYGISESDIEADMTYCTQFKNADVGKKYTFFYDSTTHLLVHDKLVWAYLQVQKTRHMLYGIIPTGTTTACFVTAVDRDNVKTTIEVKNEEIGHEIVNAICKSAPHVICGFHKDLETLANSDFAQIVRMVDEKKAEVSMNMDTFSQDMTNDFTDSITETASSEVE